jgi:hypothetical protein
MKIMRPQIEDRQRKIMSLQDSVNLKIKRLYELEKLTVDYLSKTQSDAVEIEQMQGFLKLTDDIKFFSNECFKLCDEGKFDDSKATISLKMYSRFAVMFQKLNDFAKKDGNKNLLNNQDRDELIAFVFSNLREMRGILALSYRELSVASKYRYLSDILK